MQAWCKEQMLKLQGQDDLTLVRFLLSCSSTGEVAEYISAYLGKSAEVSKFTSEFLKRKYAEASGKKVQPAPSHRLVACVNVIYVVVLKLWLLWLRIVQSHMRWREE